MGAFMNSSLHFKRGDTFYNESITQKRQLKRTLQEQSLSLPTSTLELQARGGIGLDQCLSMAQNYDRKHGIPIPRPCIGLPPRSILAIPEIEGSTTHNIGGLTSSEIPIHNTSSTIPTAPVPVTEKATSFKQRDLVIGMSLLSAVLAISIITYMIIHCIRKKKNLTKGRGIPRSNVDLELNIVPAQDSKTSITINCPTTIGQSENPFVGNGRTTIDITETVMPNGRVSISDDSTFGRVSAGLNNQERLASRVTLVRCKGARKLEHHRADSTKSLVGSEVSGDEEVFLVGDGVGAKSGESPCAEKTFV